MTRFHTEQNRNIPAAAGFCKASVPFLGKRGGAQVRSTYAPQRGPGRPRGRKPTGKCATDREEDRLSHGDHAKSVRSRIVVLRCSLSTTTAIAAWFRPRQAIISAELQNRECNLHARAMPRFYCMHRLTQHNSIYACDTAIVNRPASNFLRRLSTPQTRPSYASVSYRYGAYGVSHRIAMPTRLDPGRGAT